MVFVSQNWLGFINLQRLFWFRKGSHLYFHKNPSNCTMSHNVLFLLDDGDWTRSLIRDQQVSHQGLILPTHTTCSLKYLSFSVMFVMFKCHPKNESITSECRRSNDNMCTTIGIRQFSFMENIFESTCHMLKS